LQKLLKLVTASLLLRAGRCSGGHRQLNGTSARWCVGTFRRHGTDGRTGRNA